MIVVDASVIVTALADDGDDGDRAEVAFETNDWSLPSCWISRSSRRGGACSPSEVSISAGARLALEDLRQLRVDRVSHLALIPRCWELRNSFTVYDAAYVALAEVLGVSLLTADNKLANAHGARCRVEVLR